ncbi:MAG: hypothetical protein H7146_11920 [Burkholderiaceae bacterium]|nr:hypothetical protein [Microbacteriaceae bacterium]
MRILLKLVLDCDPETAWRVIRSPAGLKQVSHPLMEFSSLEDGGFPAQWPAGEHPVSVKGLGVVPLGEQVIAISYPEPRGDARLVRDTGFGLSGIFTSVSSWRHTMAVAPGPGGTTLYRDELAFEAGAITPLLWPVYWIFWQYRAKRMSALARTW